MTFKSLQIFDVEITRVNHFVLFKVNNPIASTTLPSSEQVEEYYSTVLIELTKSNSAELLMKTVESITSVLTDYVSILKNLTNYHYITTKMYSSKCNMMRVREREKHMHIHMHIPHSYSLYQTRLTVRG